MKFIDGYRDQDLIKEIVRRIENSATGNYTFMEVCGGHTAAIRRFGIVPILPRNIRLISGPGCPVCVTGKEFSGPEDSARALLEILKEKPK